MEVSTLEARDAALESSGNFPGALGQPVLTLVVFFTWKNAPQGCVFHLNFCCCSTDPPFSLKVRVVLVTSDLLVVFSDNDSPISFCEPIIVT